MDALAVRYLMTRREVSDSWEPVFGGESPIYENKEALPRAFIVSDYRIAADEEFVNLLASGAERLRREAIIAGTTPLPPREIQKPEPNATATFLRDAPDEIIIETNSKRPGLLVLMDSYYPGWRAWVYETETPIMRANYGFRGIEVPPGKQVVTMRYDPASYRVGLFVSLLAIAILAGVFISIYLSLPERAAKRARRS
jgi:hypothetical protein